MNINHEKSWKIGVRNLCKQKQINEDQEREFIHVNKKSSLNIASDILEFRVVKRNLDLISYGVFKKKITLHVFLVSTTCVNVVTD